MYPLTLHFCSACRVLLAGSAPPPSAPAVDYTGPGVCDGCGQPILPQDTLPAQHPSGSSETA